MDVPGVPKRVRRGERKRAQRKRWALVAGLVVCALAAAGLTALAIHRRGSDPEVLLARAEQQFSAGEFAAAAINLKNVVHTDGSSSKARLLLGRTYLKAGNPAGALKELGKARELGAKDPELDQALVRAMILTARFDDAATEIAVHGDTSKPEWQVLGGMLDLAQQRLDKARATFSAILEKVPDNEEARRGLMQAELAAGNADRARSEVERLLASSADDPTLWIIKGELDLHDQDAAQARTSFQRALELAPANPLALLGLAQTHLVLGELDLAANRLDALGNGDADPRVNFLRARIAEARGDDNSALIHLRKVLQVAPAHRESLVMAAKINFALGAMTRARDYIGRLLELEPNNDAARRMLGAIDLASGRLDGLDQLGEAAVDTQKIKDPGILALLGTAYLKHGKLADGEASLERAVELAPDSLPIRTQLALSKLSNGHVDEAVAELQAVVAEDPSFAQANIMLALAYLTQKKNDEALAVATAMVTANPDNALAHNVHGYVLEVSGDRAAARSEFEAALAKNESFHPARINLARLAIQDGEREEARKHLQGVLDLDPYNVFALLGVAALALEQNQIDEAEKLWLLAREHNPDAVAPRLLLARHYRAKNNLALAQTLVEEAYKLAPFAAQVQAEYASTMLQNGAYAEALKAARALTARAPDSLQGLELLARVYNQIGDEAGLTETLERIAEKAPHEVSAQMLLARLAIRRKDYAEADRIIEALRARADGSAPAYELQGDMNAARGDAQAALAAYTLAHDAVPGSDTLLKIDRIERELGQGGNRLADWLQQHPNDLQVRLVHASYLQQEGAGSDAIAEYESMLQSQGNNPVVLNNLAWLYHERGEKQALELARRAMELAPKQPEIMDTYGWIALAQGQREQGLEALTEAAELSPQNPDIAYHLASALSQAGQPELAKAKLHKVLAEHKDFTTRKEAEILLAKLGQQ